MPAEAGQESFGKLGRPHGRRRCLHRNLHSAGVPSKGHTAGSVYVVSNGGDAGNGGADGQERWVGPDVEFVGLEERAFGLAQSGKIGV